MDAVLQAALAADPAGREAVVDSACAGDDALRAEVASLLEAHLAIRDDFLEPPVAFAAPVAPPAAIDEVVGGAELPRRRMVSAAAAVRAIGAALLIGLAAGVLLDRSPLARGTRGDVATVAPVATVNEAPLAVVDRAGRLVRGIPATRPWTPRFSPDGRSVAYGAFGPGRESSDLWITDLEAGTTRRLTDDDRDANDPRWSPDGRSIAFSSGGPGMKRITVRSLLDGSERVLASGGGSEFPGDWTRDAGAVLATQEVGEGGHDIMVQPANGAPARPYAATRADETAPRISPDGRWVAFTSTASGRAEVYFDGWPAGGHPVLASSGGGEHPVWRADGRELFYWRDGALVAVPVTPAPPHTSAPPALGTPVELFRAPYGGRINTMYDVSPDGQRFVIAMPR